MLEYPSPVPTITGRATVYTRAQRLRVNITNSTPGPALRAGEGEHRRELEWPPSVLGRIARKATRALRRISRHVGKRFIAPAYAFDALAPRMRQSQQIVELVLPTPAPPNAVEVVKVPSVAEICSQVTASRRSWSRK